MAGPANRSRVALVPANPVSILKTRMFIFSCGKRDQSNSSANVYGTTKFAKCKTCTEIRIRTSDRGIHFRFSVIFAVLGDFLSHCAPWGLGDNNVTSRFVLFIYFLFVVEYNQASCLLAGSSHSSCRT